MTVERYHPARRVGHVAAALRHHAVRRDGLFRRMGWSRKR